MWYLLSLQFLPLADELYQESSSLQIMTKLLPVFQLLAHSVQLFVWLHLHRYKPFTTGAQTPVKLDAVYAYDVLIFMNTDLLCTLLALQMRM